MRLDAHNPGCFDDVHTHTLTHKTCGYHTPNSKSISRKLNYQHVCVYVWLDNQATVYTILASLQDSHECVYSISELCAHHERSHY